MRNKFLASLTASILASVAGLAFSMDCDAKKQWTVTDRQVALRKRVDQGFKANELTEKESKKLNERLDELNSDLDKMKEKNGGKLSYKDEGRLEKDLNGISIDIDKYKLNKRVTPH